MGIFDKKADKAKEDHASSSSSHGDTNTDGHDLEKIHTAERVGSHENYYEKGGLRTEGDGRDHSGRDFKMTPKLWGAVVAMSFLWTESQIPVYLFGAVAHDIYGDIGGVDRWTWLVLGNLIALAAVCPFVGAISDLLGRRNAALISSVLILIGMIVTSTAKTMNIVIAGMVLAGAGAGIAELTSIAGTAELVPTKLRAPMVGLVVFSIFPWTPAVLWGQLIQDAGNNAEGRGGWRYCGAVCGIWAFLGLIFTFFFYFPPKPLLSEGYSKRKILARIDWLGGLLSISGFLLFLMGLQWGATQYGWSSTHCLVPLILGGCLIIAFGLWEKYGAKYPMLPGRLKKDPRILLLTLVITFISGGNFFCLLFFWPTQSFNMYGNDPVQLGLRGLPIGLGIIFGAVICLLLIWLTKGRIKLLMVIFTALTTAFSGAMAVGRPDNLPVMYAIVTFLSIGVGGVIVPTTVITTIICPDDLVATITALTLSIRFLGGAVGFAAFYSVFYSKLYPLMYEYVGIRAIARQLLILDVPLATQLAEMAGHGQFRELKEITDTFRRTPYAYEIIIGATQYAMAEAYRWPYYMSIAFGGVSVICSIFLGDIRKYMDDHVAVVFDKL